MLGYVARIKSSGITLSDIKVLLSYLVCNVTTIQMRIGSSECTQKHAKKKKKTMGGHLENRIRGQVIATFSTSIWKGNNLAKKVKLE